jgi:Ser/Thr protein kinase RdoA (MazF antagonist)
VIDAEYAAAKLAKYQGNIGWWLSCQELNQSTENRCFVVRTSGDRRYFLKVYSNFDSRLSTAEAMTLNSLFHGHKVLVPELVSTDNGTFIDETDGAAHILLKYVGGVEPPPNLETMRVIGRTLSRIHTTDLSVVPTSYYYTPDDLDEFVSVNSSMFGSYYDVICEATELYFSYTHTPLALVITHGDLHAGNMIRTDSGEFYIVDFEHAARATKVSDIARSIAFCCGEDSAFDVWRAIAIVSAYLEEGRLTEAERDALYVHTIYNCALSLAWLLRAERTRSLSPGQRDHSHRLAATLMWLLQRPKRTFRNLLAL